MAAAKTFTGPPTSAQFTLPAGTFNVVLIIDKAEMPNKANGMKDILRRKRQDMLRSSGLAIEVRTLKTGDFLWVARDQSNARRELVFDCLIERKRMDDLYQSSMQRDGR